MYRVYEGDLFLFTCESDEVDLYREQGFKVVKG
jgi:hypothetical protein